MLFCGDIHNKARRILPEVDEVIAKQGITRIVLLGDYVDEFGEGTKRIIDSTLFLADWVKVRRAKGLTVNVLMGNHDLPYVVNPCDLGYYQVKHSVAPHHSSAQRKLHDIMREMIDSAAVYINYKDVSTGVWRGLVASHAGFTESWSSKLGYTSIKDLIDKTNHLYSESNLYKLSWAGQEVGGFDLPSPCWAGEQELIIKGAMRGVTQVVGHTAQFGITKRTSDSGSDLWFCDMHSWISEEQRGDGSMLMLDTEVGKFEIVKPENWNRFK